MEARAGEGPGVSPVFGTPSKERLCWRDAQRASSWRLGGVPGRRLCPESMMGWEAVADTKSRDLHKRI